MAADFFSWDYQDLTTPSPATVHCFPWTPTCRITIHYIAGAAPARPGHIHPLWSVPRPLGGIPDPVTGVPTFPQTCTTCHNRLDAANAVQLPAASLELTDGDCNAQALYQNAYCQLTRTRDELEIVNGAVVPRQIPGPSR